MRYTLPGTVLVLGLLAAVGVGVGVAGTLATDVTTASIQLPAGGLYVALGSSYSSGPGIAPIVDSRCGRSGRDYASLVATARGLRLVDATCAGATAANITTTPQRVRGKQVPLQIDSVSPDAVLVTVTVGGNDIGYIRTMITDSLCDLAMRARPAAVRACGRSAPVPSKADFDRVQSSLTQLVRDVRSRAPQAKVVLVDYLPVLDATGKSCPAVPLQPDQRATLLRSYQGVVAATARAAQASGATLVQASAAGAAHTACAATPWVTGFQRPIPYHPNAAGMAGVAKLVLTTLESAPA